MSIIVGSEEPNFSMMYFLKYLNEYKFMSKIYIGVTCDKSSLIFK
jgi:hypothetical protein